MGKLTSRINGGIYIHIFLMLYLCLHFLILLYYYHLGVGFAALDALFVGFFVYALIFVLSVNRNTRAEGVVQILKLIGLNLLLAAGFIFLYQMVVDIYLTYQSPYMEYLESTKYLKGLIVWTLLSNFTVVQFIIKDGETEKAEQERTIYNEQLKKDAELFKLRQQINPHFLFNTLNSINALVKIAPDKSREMIQQLSQYFRNSIKKEDHKMITAREEMEDILLYFNIEKMRFGHRLSFLESVDEACLQYEMPPFLLQPLVENAIKYGLYGTTEAVAIAFRLYETTSEVGNKYVTFEISNPFESDIAQMSGTGFALNAIKRRLYLLYGRNDLLVTKIETMPASSSLHTYTAYISIPILNNKTSAND